MRASMRRRSQRKRLGATASSTSTTTTTTAASASAASSVSSSSSSSPTTAAGGVHVATAPRRRVVKLLVHGHEFQNGDELVLNPEFFPELADMARDKYVAEIFHASESECLREERAGVARLSATELSAARHHLLLELPPSSATPVRGKMQVSVLKDTAAAFQLAPFHDVVLRFVEKAHVALDFVEISLKDQFLSRRDLWYLKQSLMGCTMHAGKHVRVQGTRWQVLEVRVNGTAVRSGVVAPRTKFAFRSRTSRVVWLMQLSPEMWEMANSGKLYLEILLQVVQNVLRKWITHKVSHHLTIIFFARSYYPEMDVEEREVGYGALSTPPLSARATPQLTPRALHHSHYPSTPKARPHQHQYHRAPPPRSPLQQGSAWHEGAPTTESTFPFTNKNEDTFAIGVDEDGRHYQDFYRIVAFDSTVTDVQPLLVQLKTELNEFPHICGWRSSTATPEPSSSSGTSASSCFAQHASSDHSSPRSSSANEPSSSTPLPTTAPFSSTLPSRRRGTPSNARDGNLLEAINLVLNIFEKHHIDRHLARSGQSVVLFTAGNGIFCVNRRLSEITEQRMMDHGIGIDMIALSTPPLHKCPLFLFRHSDLADVTLPPGRAMDGLAGADTCTCGNAPHQQQHLLQHAPSANQLPRTGTFVKQQRHSRTNSSDWGNPTDAPLPPTTAPSMLAQQHAHTQSHSQLIFHDTSVRGGTTFAGNGGGNGVGGHAQGLCKHCVHRVTARKRYAVPLWIPLSFVQEHMMIDHRCPLEEEITSRCPVCCPDGARATMRAFEPLPMCRMFPDLATWRDPLADATTTPSSRATSSSSSLPAPLAALLRLFQPIASSTEEDGDSGSKEQGTYDAYGGGSPSLRADPHGYGHHPRRFSDFDELRMRAFSGDFSLLDDDSYLSRGRDSELVRTRAPSLASMSEYVMDDRNGGAAANGGGSDGGGSLPKVRSFSPRDVARSRYRQNFDGYDDAVFTVVTPAVKRKGARMSHPQLQSQFSQPRAGEEDGGGQGQAHGSSNPVSGGTLGIVGNRLSSTPPLKPHSGGGSGFFHSSSASSSKKRRPASSANVFHTLSAGGGGGGATGKGHSASTQGGQSTSFIHHSNATFDSPSRWQAYDTSSPSTSRLLPPRDSTLSDGRGNGARRRPHSGSRIGEARESHSVGSGPTSSRPGRISRSVGDGNGDENDDSGGHGDDDGDQTGEGDDNDGEDDVDDEADLDTDDYAGSGSGSGIVRQHRMLGGSLTNTTFQLLVDGMGATYANSPILLPNGADMAGGKGTSATDDLFHSSSTSHAYLYKQLTSNQRRWSQVRAKDDRNPYRRVQNVLKWKSLCCPALLPLTTDYVPGPKELQAHYTESFYSVTLPERDEQNGATFRDYRELVMEMVAQRFSQDFQLVAVEVTKRNSGAGANGANAPANGSGTVSAGNGGAPGSTNTGLAATGNASPNTKSQMTTAANASTGSGSKSRAASSSSIGNILASTNSNAASTPDDETSRGATEVSADGVESASTTVYRLSMGHRIHEIMYNAESQTVDVKRYLQRATARSDVDIMEYRYSLWSPVADGFLFATQEFRKYPRIEYSWNYLDQLICGYYDDMSEGIRYKRILYCIIPPQLPGTQDDDADSNSSSHAERKAVLTTYMERCRKFIEYIKSKAESAASFPSISTSGVERAASTNGGLASSGAAAFKRVPQQNVKMALHASDSPLSQNWLSARLDTEVLPTQCYHVEVQWLVCRSALVDDFITSLVRRCKQLGLELVSVAENGISSNLDLHPLICPIFLPVSDPMQQRLVEDALVERFGFCCEGLHAIPHVHLNHDDEYRILTDHGVRGGGPDGSSSNSGAPPLSSSARPRSLGRRRATAYYRQYMHRTLACFVRMTQTGLVWISNRKLQCSDIQPVFDQIRLHVEAVRVGHAALQQVLESMVLPPSDREGGHHPVLVSTTATRDMVKTKNGNVEGDRGEQAGRVGIEGNMCSGTDDEGSVDKSTNKCRQKSGDGAAVADEQDESASLSSSPTMSAIDGEMESQGQGEEQGLEEDVVLNKGNEKAEDDPLGIEAENQSVLSNSSLQQVSIAPVNNTDGSNYNSNGESNADPHTSDTDNRDTAAVVSEAISGIGDGDTKCDDEPDIKAKAKVKYDTEAEVDAEDDAETEAEAECSVNGNPALVVHATDDPSDGESCLSSAT